MAHEISTMAFTGEKPWHADETMADGRTRVLSPAATRDSALMRFEAGLDWHVHKQSLVLQHDTGVNLNDHAYAIQRLGDSKILGVVGPRYEPIQNHEAFEWFEPFIQSGECTYETAGALFGGSRIWILATLANDPVMSILPGDEVKKHLLLFFAHDGSLSIGGGLTSTRVVCWNTLSAAMKGENLFKFRHTKNAKDKLDKVREDIALANQAFSKLAESYRFLAQRKATREALKAYVQGLFVKAQKDAEEEQEISTKAQNIISRVIDLVDGGKGQEIEGVGGTWWAAYNGVTEYLSHERGHNDDTRKNSLYFGDSANLNAKALNSALEYAAVA